MACWSLRESWIRSAKKRRDRRKPKSGRGTTLRPSSQTPAWNAVVNLVKPHLSQRGDRALLARELGVHRARIGEFFDQQTAMPDAERTLQLLMWLGRQSAPPPPIKSAPE